MIHHRFLFVSLSFILMAGCATNSVQRIRQLSSPVNISDSNQQNGNSSGLDSLLRESKSSNINILFVHGIGYTENQENKEQFGDDLINAIKNHYSANSSSVVKQTSCKDKTGLKITGQIQTKDENGKVTSKLPIFYTDDPSTSIWTNSLGCLDKTIISLSDGKTITMFRYLWDNDFYDQVEWKHIGYDDVYFDSEIEEDGEKIFKKRYKTNRKIKDQIISYGLSDAALYMGNVGKFMRKGLKGAICAVINNILDTVPKQSSYDTDELCTDRSSSSETPFVLIAHSLGSRISYDVLHTDMTVEFSKFIQSSLSQKQLNVYLLANQIPLLALGRLHEQPKNITKLPLDLKFVAFSEINDLLTYELVPYFEHLYKFRCTSGRLENFLSYSNCPNNNPDSTNKEAQTALLQEKIRNNLTKELGFDVVDVRLSFAGRVLGFLPLINPEVAHSGYLNDKSVHQILFCGIKDGIPNTCSWSKGLYESSIRN